MNKSYVSSEDSMFEEGCLCDPSSDGIKVFLEVGRFTRENLKDSTH